MKASKRLTPAERQWDTDVVAGLSSRSATGRLAARARPAYGPDSPFSYFYDLGVVAEAEARWNAGFEQGLGPALGDPSSAEATAIPHPVFGGVPQARERLATLEHELRDITAAGSGFIPAAGPQYVAAAFATAARARAVVAPIFPQRDLPPAGMDVDLAEATTGLSVAVQEAEHDAVAVQDIVEATRSTPIATISGLVNLSQQLYDRANGGIDLYIAGELGAAYATALDVELIEGTGTAGHTQGLTQNAGTSATYTAGTPTAATLWTAILECVGDVAQALGSVPSHVLAHPRRLAWLLADLDVAAAGRPLGLTFVPAAGIPAASGSGTGEDAILVVAAAELPLFTSPPSFLASPGQTGAGTLTTRIRVHGYAALAGNRRSAAIGTVTGAGLGGISF